MTYQNIVITLIILSILAYILMGNSTIRGNFEKETGICDPVYNTATHELCFIKGELVEYLDSNIKNGCYYIKEPITVYKCDGKLKFFEKPEENCHYASRSVCANLNLIYMLLKFLIVSLIMRVLQNPIMIFIHLLMDFFTKRKSKTCQKCSKKYLLSHSSCIQDHKSSENHVVYYILFLMLMYLPYANSARIDLKDTLTRNYKGTSTMRVMDRENTIQEFLVEGHKFEIKVEHSLVKMSLQHSHNILDIVHENIVERDYFCFNKLEKCRQKYGDKKGYFQIEKAHDRFSCPFSQAVVCGYCDVKFKRKGKVFLVVDETPLIKFTIRYENNTKAFDVTKFNEHVVMDDFILNPIFYNSRYVKEKVYVEDHKMYSGNICETSDQYCFGDIKEFNDTTVYVSYDPKIEDTPDTGLSIALRQCVKHNGYSINNLNLIQQKYIDLDKDKYNVFDYEFGYFEIEIKADSKILALKCENDRRVTEINAKGCHDCMQGAEIMVKMSEGDCGKVSCTLEGRTRTMKSSKSELSFTFHTINKIVPIQCNGFKTKIELNDSKNYGNFITHEKTVYDIEPSVDLSFHWFSNVRRYVTIGITAVLGLVMIIIIYEVKAYTRHMHNLIKRRKDGYNEISITLPD
nr:MAG: glycoprotein [Artemisia fimovirus 1]